MRHKRYGMVCYARIYAALRDRPMTMFEIRESGLAKNTQAYNMVPQLAHAGLIHVPELRKVAPRQPPRPVFAAGPGQSIEGIKLPASRMMGAGIAFAAVLRALENPSTTRDIAEETGLTARPLRDLLSVMHDLNLVHVHAWIVRAKGGGARVPVYAWGRGTDAKKPKCMSSKQRNAAWRARRSTIATVKILSTALHAANSNRFTTAQSA